MRLHTVYTILRTIVVGKLLLRYYIITKQLKKKTKNPADKVGNRVEYATINRCFNEKKKKQTILSEV